MARKAAFDHLFHCYYGFGLAQLSCEASSFVFSYGGAGYPQKLLLKFKYDDHLGKVMKYCLLLLLTVTVTEISVPEISYLFGFL